jgi:6-phosphogluconolactonase (cycloisomerase 2 family)
MRPIRTSPFLSGGRDPVAEAVSPDNTNLYVVNHDDNTVVQFLIGSDGKLYPQNTVNVPGIFPMAAAANGANLFVVSTYQPLSTCSSVSPCPGAISAFPILTKDQANALTPSQIADTLGTPVVNPQNGSNYWSLSLPAASTDVIVPTAVNVLKSGTAVFVTAYDSSVTPNVGYIFGFVVGKGGGLTPIPGSPFLEGTAQTHPSAIASDSTSGYVYVTDATSGLVNGYSVAPSSGALTAFGSVSAGNQPSAIVVDPRYLYAFVANQVDGTVSAYSIGSGGALSPIGTYDAGLQPVAIGIDPSTSHFLFTVNFLGPDISDFELNATTGALVHAQGSPYKTNAQPTAVAAIPHGTPSN